MTMISFFTAQVSNLRNGNPGQASSLFLITLAAILVLVFSSIHTSHLGTGRVASANSIDAIALSAATWEARCLNLISSLNDGILQCLGAIRNVCIVWAALAIAACTGAGMPAFTAYSERAPGLIRSYWNCAKQLERWSETIRKTAPYLVLAETTDLAMKLQVLGMITPGNPGGPHDGSGTLELHLKPGSPRTLADLLSPITDVPARIGKSKFGKKFSGGITQTIETGVRSILEVGPDPIRLLEPEEDFSDRQKIRYSGTKTVVSPYIPYIGKGGKNRFFSESNAEPYGGDVTEATWKSRWIEGSKNR